MVLLGSAPLLILADPLNNASLELMLYIAGARGSLKMSDLAERSKLSVILPDELSNVVMEDLVTLCCRHWDCLLNGLHPTLRDRLVDPKLLERGMDTLEVLEGDRLRVLFL